MPDYPDDPPEPWERQPRETAKAYAAFCAYRDLPPHDRSLRKAAEAIGKSPEHLASWSRRLQWVERANAWDEEQRRTRQRLNAEAIAQMAENHARIATAALRKAAERLQTLDARDLQPQHVASFIDLAVRVERDARGVGTQGAVVIQQEGAIDPNMARAILADPVARTHALAIFERLHGGGGNDQPRASGDPGEPGNVAPG